MPTPTAQGPKASQPPAMDELAEVLKRKVLDVEVGGKTIHLHKWPIRMGIKHSATLLKIVTQSQAGKKTGTEVVADILKQDVSELFLKSGDQILTILAETVVSGNFETFEEATTWVDTLSMDEAVVLLAEVIKQNYVPLMSALGKVLDAVRGQKRSAILTRTTQQQTSSPS